MCGFAGYSLQPASRIDRRLAAQALLAAIAERGADAAGYAYRAPDGGIETHKQRSGASALLEHLAVPAEATQLLVHVRDYTKGHPRIEANNHPICHGPIVGVHNGIIVNDEEVFATHAFVRARPEMTVDSEAIFALVAAGDGRAATLEQLRGSMAAAWLDERNTGAICVARGVGRPLWLGEGRKEAFFASTREALEIVERYAEVRLRKRELPEGILLSLVDGRVAGVERFKPDRAFEETPLPAVRAPDEGAFCLRRLAAIAAT